MTKPFKIKWNTLEYSVEQHKDFADSFTICRAGCTTNTTISKAFAEAALKNGVWELQQTLPQKLLQLPEFPFELKIMGKDYVAYEVYNTDIVKIRDENEDSFRFFHIDWVTKCISDGDWIVAEGVTINIPQDTPKAISYPKDPPKWKTSSDLIEIPVPMPEGPYVQPLTLKFIQDRVAETQGRIEVTVLGNESYEVFTYLTEPIVVKDAYKLKELLTGLVLIDRALHGK